MCKDHLHYFNFKDIFKENSKFKLLQFEIPVRLCLLFKMKLIYIPSRSSTDKVIP